MYLVNLSHVVDVVAVDAVVVGTAANFSVDGDLEMATVEGNDGSGGTQLKTRVNL